MINYQTNAAIARYNALIVSTRGRLFKDKLVFNASYTHSVSRDDSQYYPTFQGISQYYGYSAWDAPDRFSLLLNYQVPGYHGGSGVLGRVASGWSISSTVSVQNGNPFNVYTSAPFAGVKNAAGQVVAYAPNSGDYNADGLNFDFPNITNYKLPTGRTAYLSGLFPAGSGIIQQPTFGQEGNEKYDSFRNPGFAQVDAVLVKDTRLAERLNLQLRFEVYNIANHPNLQGVTTDMANGNFGKSTNQYTPRYIQLGARITF